MHAHKHVNTLPQIIIYQKTLVSLERYKTNQCMKTKSATANMATSKSLCRTGAHGAINDVTSLALYSWKTKNLKQRRLLAIFFSTSRQTLKWTLQFPAWAMGLFVSIHSKRPKHKEVKQELITTGQNCAWIIICAHMKAALTKQQTDISRQVRRFLPLSCKMSFCQSVCCLVKGIYMLKMFTLFFVQCPNKKHSYFKPDLFLSWRPRQGASQKHTSRTVD